MQKEKLIKLFKEAYPGLQETSKMKHFSAIVNCFQPFTIVARLSILDVCKSAGYASTVDWLDGNDY